MRKFLFLVALVLLSYSNSWAQVDAAAINPVLIKGQTMDAYWAKYKKAKDIAEKSAVFMKDLQQVKKLYGLMEDLKCLVDNIEGVQLSLARKGITIDDCITNAQLNRGGYLLESIPELITQMTKLKGLQGGDRIEVLYKAIDNFIEGEEIYMQIYRKLNQINQHFEAIESRKNQRINEYNSVVDNKYSTNVNFID